MCIKYELILTALRYKKKNYLDFENLSININHNDWKGPIINWLKRVITLQLLKFLKCNYF